VTGDLDSDFFSPARPRIFAHRGCAGDYPENTLPSFRAAAGIGAEYFELDVHMARDGEIVVSHDESLERNCGTRGIIRELDWASIAAADAGWGFTADGGATHPFRGRGIRIPRLAEVLAEFPAIHVIVEIKQQSPSLVRAMLAVIDAAGARRRVLIASEHQEPISELRALAPGMPTNFPYGEVAEFLQAMAAPSTDYRPRADALQIPPEYEGWKLVTPDSIAFAHRLGVEVHVWTVNEEAAIGELLEMGVDGILTDFPARGLVVARARRRG
jgi:glycerophosphoryl diester phosphodiesterase